jgi:hypothetical protein
MSTRPPRLLLVTTVAVLLAACGPSASPPPSTAPSELPPSTSPSATTSGTQSDTEWGRIWDAVPAGFPRFPGSTIADDASPERVSARYAVPDGDPQAIATWMQDALETATFSTEGLNGPFEDGGFVIDSVGAGECRIQTSISPEGGTTFITVLYGAGCPE